MHSRSGERGVQTPQVARDVTPGESTPWGDYRLTDELVEKVMGWKAGLDRYIKPERSWVPKGRFLPLSDLNHAFQLLDRAATGYVLSTDGKVFKAEVRIGALVGTASGQLKPRVITVALARALGLEVRQ